MEKPSPGNGSIAALTRRSSERRPTAPGGKNPRRIAAGANAWDAEFAIIKSSNPYSPPQAKRDTSRQTARAGRIGKIKLAGCIAWPLPKRAVHAFCPIWISLPLSCAPWHERGFLFFFPKGFTPIRRSRLPSPPRSEWKAWKNTQIFKAKFCRKTRTNFSDGSMPACRTG